MWNTESSFSWAVSVGLIVCQLIRYNHTIHEFNVEWIKVYVYFVYSSYLIWNECCMLSFTHLWSSYVKSPRTLASRPKFCPRSQIFVLSLSLGIKHLSSPCPHACKLILVKMCILKQEQIISQSTLKCSCSMFAFIQRWSVVCCTLEWQMPMMTVT